MSLELSPDEYNRFYVSMQFILRPDIEGGYVNDPGDSGGETKWGISKKAYPNEDIKALTPQRTLEIYYRDYWKPASCDTLSYPCCVLVFDAAVNMGVSAALKLYKASEGNKDKFIALRKQRYVDIVKKKPADQKFLAGWLNRVQKLEKYLETTSI